MPISLCSLSPDRRAFPTLVSGLACRHGLGLDFGEGQVVQPWWAARAREYLGDLPFLPVRRIASEDFSNYRRVWVITLPGHRVLEGPFDDGTYSVQLEQEIGGLELWRFQLPDTGRTVVE